MPIYQYQCSECGHRLEALQKMSDAKLVDCPACQAPALRKQLTAASFKLKGTGWYETDFKNSGKQPPKKAVAGDSAKQSGSANDAQKPAASESAGSDSNSSDSNSSDSNSSDSKSSDSKSSDSKSSDSKSSGSTEVGSSA